MCKAGHDHKLLKLSPSTWAALPLLDYQLVPADDDGPRVVLEMRDCACGSTLCLDVTANFPQDPPAVVK